MRRTDIYAYACVSVPTRAYTGTSLQRTKMLYAKIRVISFYRDLRIAEEPKIYETDIWGYRDTLKKAKRFAARKSAKYGEALVEDECQIPDEKGFKYPEIIKSYIWGKQTSRY